MAFGPAVKGLGLVQAAACAALLAASLPAAPAPKTEPKKAPGLWDIQKTLAGKTFVDLTHAFRPGIPKWKGYPDEDRKIIYNYDPDGFRAERFTFAGPWGTHADAPAQFHKGLKTLDEIPVNDMLAPIAVIDISNRAEGDPDTLVGVADIQAWESRNGKIPKGAFVTARTDWYKRWPDQALMQNRDEKGRMHSPGWSVDALKFLVEERNIGAIGHETIDTDAGFNVSVDRYPTQTYIHGENRFQIAMLARLDQLPEAGAIAVIAFPKPEKGAGFPARVFAILP